MGKPRLGAMYLLLLTGCCFSAAAGKEESLKYVETSPASNDPQAIYSADPQDAWNRVFYELFTRSISCRISSHFEGSAPLTPLEFEVAFLPGLKASEHVFGRNENGDRAIEPLYDGRKNALADPRYSRLKTAIEDALRDQEPRSALENLLMQTDVWAAFDRLYAVRASGEKLLRRNELLKLLARFVRKLALGREQLARIPDNYNLAKGTLALPDLFSASSGWLEMEWAPDLVHDVESDHRRAARLFVKPASKPDDPSDFLNAIPSLEESERTRRFEAATLVLQNLAVSRDGQVVPTNLTYDIQVRRFEKNPTGRIKTVTFLQYELSRKQAIDDSKSGGFVELTQNEPAYLPTAGNDLSFASRQRGGKPVLVPLRVRCQTCHAGGLLLMGFQAHFQPGTAPRIKALVPSEKRRLTSVASRKMKREDWKELLRLWEESN